MNSIIHEKLAKDSRFNNAELIEFFSLYRPEELGYIVTEDDLVDIAPQSLKQLVMLACRTILRELMTQTKDSFDCDDIYNVNDNVGKWNSETCTLTLNSVVVSKFFAKLDPKKRPTLMLEDGLLLKKIAVFASVEDGMSVLQRTLRLSLQGCEFYTRDLDDVYSLVKCCPMLKVLDLSYNRLYKDDSTAQKLSTLLSYNNITVCLCGNDLQSVVNTELFDILCEENVVDRVIFVPQLLIRSPTVLSFISCPIMRERVYKTHLQYYESN